MNYYEHHIGDYDKNTSHLTACEDGIYCRLIRRYYDKECPLPADVSEVKRLARARTPEERKAVDAVLREFFRLEDDGWHHGKCDEIISAFQASEPEREAKKKNEDTRLARHRAERAALFAVINAAGEHMPYNAPISDVRAAAARISGKTATPTATPPATQTDGTATPTATGTATPATATQTPDTRHQTPEEGKDISEPTVPRRLASPTDPPGEPKPTIPCPYGAIVDAYHAELPGLPRVKLRDGPTWTARQKAMRSLWGWVLSSRKSDGERRAQTGDQALAWIVGYFARARDNDFVMGRNARGPGHENWRADLDFLLSSKGLKQVIEKTLEHAA
jgi:uncharacterized protein YdaU (DUF1376 family)